MSTNSPRTDDKELDLAMISKGMGNAYESFNSFLFKCVRFVVKNSIVIAVLFIVGIGLGLYLDRTEVYDNEVIVMPNFQSTDYLYEKVALINTKAKEHDTLFLKSIGIANPEKFIKITIKPINDIYNFVENNEYRFKTLQLMAEDNDMQAILLDKATSKNYTYHEITFTTVGKTTHDKTVKPLMDFLNNSDYFSKIQKQFVENIRIKIKENDIIIAQIDGILNQLAQNKMPAGNIYSGDSQLNDVITSKDQLVREQGTNRMSLINLDKVIKESSTALNVKDSESITGKLKFILPFVFIGFFIFVYLFVAFYKKQSLKQQTTINQAS